MNSVGNSAGQRNPNDDVGVIGKIEFSEVRKR
jgi:hypothetical protein